MLVYVVILERVGFGLFVLSSTWRLGREFTLMVHSPQGLLVGMRIHILHLNVTTSAHSLTTYKQPLYAYPHQMRQEYHK